MERAITSGQGVLLPDSTRKNRKQRTVTVAVNSRDRNLTADYLSNQFRWTFRRPLKDVVSVELVNGCIPADLYNINVGWNIFSFKEGPTDFIVTLTPGQYSATELCTELQRALNALVGKVNTYAVAYSGITKRATVTGTGAATFIFKFLTSPHTDTIDSHTGAIQVIGCPARLFGFDTWDYTSSGGIIVAPNRMDPSLFLQRIYLHLNADNSVDFNRVEMGAGRKDCFHIVYLDQLTGGYYMLNKDIHTPIYYSSPAPIARMATLNVSIRDEFYRLVDLGGHDFTLLFEVTFLD